MLLGDAVRNVLITNGNNVFFVGTYNLKKIVSVDESGTSVSFNQLLQVLMEETIWDKGLVKVSY